MGKNIYEIFGLSPIDDPMSSKSFKKIQSTFVNACASSDSSNFLELLKAANILLDPEKRKLYDEKNPEIQALKRKEMLKRKIKEIALKKIEDKLPSGCFIEDIDCNLSFHSTPIVSITISKPTGKWVELYIDRAAAYGENAERKYSSPGAPYFNSSGHKGCSAYGVEDSDKDMPEYIKDFLDYPIPLAVPKGEHFLEKRELRTLGDIDKMRQLEKEGIFLIDGVPGRKGTPAKRMIVSSLKINYFFPPKEITDNDIVELESLLNQIEVVSNLRRVEIAIVSENDSYFNTPAWECIKYFQEHYALVHHFNFLQRGPEKLYILQMEVPTNKFEKLKEDVANYNVTFVDYGEISENQSLDGNNQISGSNRKK